MSPSDDAALPTPSGQPLGALGVPTLAQGMAEGHEHLGRFPVLYYFESGDEETAQLAGTGWRLLLTALRCANPGAIPHAPTYADVFELILGRLLEGRERPFRAEVRGRGSAQCRLCAQKNHSWPDADLQGPTRTAPRFGVRAPWHSRWGVPYRSLRPQPNAWRTNTLVRSRGRPKPAG